MPITLTKVIKGFSKQRQKAIRINADQYIADYKSLKDIRKQLGITQVDIANKQGVKQVNISNLEKRTDMHISTLKKYVEAMGCQLEINIRMPNKKTVKINTL
jgi:predicted transcriptional regulator